MVIGSVTSKSFSWPEQDVRAFRRTYDLARAEYRAGRVEGRHQLTLSTFYAMALNRGLDHELVWLPAVPPRSGWNGMSKKTVSVSWPTPFLERILRRFEHRIVHPHPAWNLDFALTQGAFFYTSVVYGIEEVEDWLHEIPDDLT